MNRAIWVCMPTYNEYENLERTLRELWRYMPEASVLVIDDGSRESIFSISLK